MSATPASKRKRPLAPPDTPSAAAADLIGRKIFVPAEIFPKEETPLGQNGWKAIVTSINRSKPGTVLVRFPGFGADEYYFPIDAVRSWQEQDEHALPSSSAPRSASKPSRRANLEDRSTYAAVAGTTPAVPYPSPAKSSAARRSVQRRAEKHGGEEAGVGGPAALASPNSKAAITVRQPNRQEKDAGASPADPAIQKEPGARAGPHLGTEGHHAAGEEVVHEATQQHSVFGASFDENECEEAGQLQEPVVLEDAGLEQEGRPQKRQRLAGGSVWRDGMHMLLGSVLTYGLLRWMYPLEG